MAGAMTSRSCDEQEDVMGVGAGLLLVAAGAVLAWAVNFDSSGINLHTVGYILLAVGAIGILLSLIFWSSWAGPGNFGRSRRGYRDGPGRRTYVEDEIVE
jgi:hypothetical protein